AANQERGQRHDVEVAVDGDGRILALRDRFVHDAGAYTPYGLVVPLITSTQLPGPYRLRNYAVEFEVVYTNTAVVTPYRGGGRPRRTATVATSVSASRVTSKGRGSARTRAPTCGSNRAVTSSSPPASRPRARATRRPSPRSPPRSSAAIRPPSRSSPATPAASTGARGPSRAVRW